MKATKGAALLIDCCTVTGESKENSLKALHTNVTKHKLFDGFEVSWSNSAFVKALRLM